MLTDEQIKDEASHHGFIGSTEMLVKFARAILAKWGSPVVATKVTIPTSTMDIAAARAHLNQGAPQNGD